ncbi:MAG TPA: MTH938/NDUFAF3 family protein [Permianibacter sp.]|nr:MTH938/NDUFAF3 family protein [Permianibacter sp.]
MQLSLDNGATDFIVRAYEPGRIRINDTWYSEPVLLSPGRLETGVLPASFAALSVTDIERWCASEAEVLLLGCGTRHQLPNVQWLATAQRARRTLDIMDTRAACHTYVVLASEERKVLAALFP